jgi:hypothetical protein
MEILTEISLTEAQANFYKKFKNLSVNETPMSQGQGVIRISPFDDYFLFTLYDEIEGVDSPIDLINVGTIFMVFMGKNDEIRIPNFTNVKDIDMSNGQVLFRIGKDDSQKILALDNRNFYISTMMTDGEGKSDESVLYTGKFLSFQEAADASVQNQLDLTQLEYSKELAKMQEDISNLNNEVANRDNLIAEQAAVIEVLKQSNQNLSNEIAVITANSSSTQIQALLKEAEEAQKSEEIARKNRQQILSIDEVKISEQTMSKKKSFFKQAAKQLRSNITKANPIT